MAKNPDDRYANYVWGGYFHVVGKILDRILGTPCNVQESVQECDHRQAPTAERQDNDHDRD